jgi:hypothetical protein
VSVGMSSFAFGKLDHAERYHLLRMLCVFRAATLANRALEPCGIL